MRTQKIKKSFVESLAPAACPRLSKERNYLLPEQAPYLAQLLSEAKKRGYSSGDILSAWDGVLAKKAQTPPQQEELDLEEAMRVLFHNLSYDETKLHYLAMLSLN